MTRLAADEPKDPGHDRSSGGDRNGGVRSEARHEKRDDGKVALGGGATCGEQQHGEKKLDTASDDPRQGLPPRGGAARLQEWYWGGA